MERGPSADVANVAHTRAAPVVLHYHGWLPKISNGVVHPLARYRLKRKALVVFGVVPPMLYARTHATVDIVQVLGRGQRPMDNDNFALRVKGLRDALIPSYIVDDRPTWAHVSYTHDATRRHLGPFVEVVIRYDDA